MAKTANDIAAPLPAGAKVDARNPIVQALHEMAVTVLGDQLRTMFEKADDILFDSAEKAQSSDEQRLYLDTMRIVRVQRAQIIKAFQNSLEGALSQIGEQAAVASNPYGDLSDMSQWSLQDGDQLEERIAVANMETKATSLHSHELVELQRRLARLADMSGGGFSPEAMSPARIIRAFQDSVHDLQVDFPIKLVIYKLFDRVVVGRMSEVFMGANHLLAGHGVEPKETAATAPRRNPAAAAFAGADGASGAGASGAPAWANGVDAGRFSQFMGGAAASSSAPRWSGPAGYGAPASAGAGYPASWPAYGPAYGSQNAGGPPPNYDDSWLAHDISHILQSYAQGQQPQAPAWLPPQNVGLVARMFDGYYNDPRLPEAMKPLLARLQMPVMKAALSDPQFFADAGHPARRASNSLYELALQLGAGGAKVPDQAFEELQSLVEEVARTFQLDPARLKRAASEPLNEDVADEFLREQERTQKNRNRQQIERVRRIVAHELKMRVGERRLAPGAMRLMLSGFGPRLCVDYIRDGIEGHAWNATMALVERVLQSFDHVPLMAADERVHEEAEIAAAVTNRLSEVGFSQEKLEEVVAGLLEAYLEPSPVPAASVASVHAAAAEDGVQDEAGATEVLVEAAVPAAPRITPEEELLGLLSIVLLPDGWFTVLDASTQTKHWVRVKAYYPAQHSVLLGHYMEPRFLKLRTAVFATELCAGRIVAIDPAPELQNAIARIATLPITPEPAGPVVWAQT
ncbi:DUF1631 domain-containing protein [Solimonas terrae]|uniref:DUF1631 domain-containing protein n=2 Tax=Solimonas terrae TaxID=1396819 RepID=A0A6M2BQW8_9GAMM|nr:DUF1631 domain-containing protein [Solimonas terrae]